MAGNRTAENLILQFTRPSNGPAGQKSKVIDLHSIHVISGIARRPELEIETLCLTLGVVPLRYLRNIGTLGIEGQLQLLRSTVAVCGAGGLGGTIIELLARQGVGHLIIIDNGRFVENNLNRQILATEGNLGRAKTRVAAERVREINSAVSVKALNKYINAQNAMELIDGSDVVMDALDKADTRLLVAGACNKLKVPFVHGAIAGLCGQLMTIMPGDKGLGTVYGPPDEERPLGMEAVTGNPSATPSIVAAWQVQEAVKIITGIGSPIRNRLVFLDFGEGSFEEMRFTPAP
jgi:molybdopterin/thiamine biosynthesis adenylyltransferase